MRILRYLAVGGTAALVDWSVFWALTQGTQLKYQFAAVVSFLLATLANYLLSIRYVFKSGLRFSRRRETALVYLVSMVGLGINVLAMQILVSAYAFHLLVAKVCATGIVFFWNYFARASFVFGKPNDRG